MFCLACLFWLFSLTLFVFLPFLESVPEGVNEDVTRSEAAKAVQSIPAYVEASDLFIALVPEVEHQDCRLILRNGGECPRVSC